LLQDWFRGTPDEYESEATTYIVYSGPFHVEEANKSLSHSMIVSLFPNWIGQTQPRIVTIDGDMLRLRSASPIHSGGKSVMSYLQWRRARRG
jgi:Lipocalin-like domain